MELKTCPKCTYAKPATREFPLASHLLYTQPGVLNDDIPEERTRGIEAGLAWSSKSEGSVIYIDRGISVECFMEFNDVKLTRKRCHFEVCIITVSN